LAGAVLGLTGAVTRLVALAAPMLRVGAAGSEC
jgi:hypothetical protein